MTESDPTVIAEITAVCNTPGCPGRGDSDPDKCASVATPEARTVRLRGIAELLTDSDFDSVGHLHNDDARFLLAEVDRLNRAITRVLRLLAAQEAYCGDERLDVPSWVQSVRNALNDE